MIGKILEALFRHKLLVLLPPVLIPLIVGPIALLTATAYYETFAGVWVDRPTYLDYVDDTNRYLTPAQNQANRFGELLRTRSFLVDVAGRTPLAPLVGSTKGEERIREFIGKNLSLTPAGSNLVVFRFRSENPRLSFTVLNALLQAYQEKAVADRSAQATLAISFYEARLKTAQEELDKSNNALRRYVAANPRLSSIDPDRGAAATTASRLGLPTAAIDPQLSTLLNKVQVEQADVERLRGSLEKARLDTEASLEGQEMGFQVVDAPQQPRTPVSERRKLLIFPAAGLLAGLGLSTILLIVLVAGDRTVRSEADLAGSARVLGVVPRLRPRRKGLPRRAGPDLTRRAIGFIAGAQALPAPSAAGAGR